MKNKVIDYFLNDGSFESGKQLYINYPGARLSFIKQLQYQTDTKQNRETLHYELGQLAGVNSAQISKMKQQAKAAAKAEQQKDPLGGYGAPELASMSYFDKKELVKKLELEVPDMKGATITAALENHFALKSEAPDSSETKNDSPETTTDENQPSTESDLTKSPEENTGSEDETPSGSESKDAPEGNE